MKKTNPVITAEGICQLLAERFALADGGRVVIAYSGGVDSHVLLHALATSSASSRWSLQAIHINHGLAAEAELWADHCSAVCQQLAVPLTIRKIDIPKSKLGVEAEARKRRYASMAKSIQHGDCLLTAHHQQDQAETVLLQLLRGTGILGLAAMPAEKVFFAGRLIRPLLEYDRQAILQYGQTHQLHWIEDSSNQQTRFARNYVRLELLPSVTRRWSQGVRLLSRTAEHAAEAVEILQEVAAHDFEAGRGPDRELSVPYLQTLSLARRHNLLRFWIKGAGLQYPSQSQLREIVKLIAAKAASGRACVQWPHGEVHRFKDKLYAMDRLQPVADCQKLSWQFDKTLYFPGSGVYLSTAASTGKGLAIDRIQSKNITVGLRLGGERCRLPGRRHHHKLKNLLQANAVPPWLRERMPLIYVNNELAAIGDRWVCQPYAAMPGEASLQIVISNTDNSNIT